MSTRAWIIGGSIVAILIVGFALYFLLGGVPMSPGGEPTGEPSFGEPAGTVTPGGTSEDVIVIETVNGATVSVPDFTKDAQSFPLGPNTFYFITDNQQTEGDKARFDIVYGSDSSISIGLFKEPLGASRRLAETELRSIIPLPDATLCTLDVFVAVPYSINQFYAGENLGLSFCSGSVKLSE